MNNKYDLIEDDFKEITYNKEPIKVYRIKALKDFAEITKDTLGGYLCKDTYMNPDDKSWVFDKAIVIKSSLSKDTVIKGNRTKLYKLQSKHCCIYDSILKKSSIQYSSFNKCSVIESSVELCTNTSQSRIKHALLSNCTNIHLAKIIKNSKLRNSTVYNSTIDNATASYSNINMSLLATKSFVANTYLHKCNITKQAHLNFCNLDNTTVADIQLSNANASESYLVKGTKIISLTIEDINITLIKGGIFINRIFNLIGDIRNIYFDVVKYNFNNNQLKILNESFGIIEALHKATFSTELT